jgi:para-aminobenzoate synthetase component I
MRYIHDGDCYQVNLAQRFEVPATGDPWSAYQALRISNPTPFAAYLNLPFVQVLSASPERFLQVRSGHVVTQPIKGTRPRAGHPRLDAQRACELRDSSKDRAENLMIVDLLRNDLAKTAASVR